MFKLIYAKRVEKGQTLAFMKQSKPEYHVKSCICTELDDFN